MNLIVMGVSGCGKSTVGQKLAELLGAAFLEGDSFHPAENVARMAAGIPLTDSDRAPWLEQLSRRMAEHDQSSPIVLACSALKKSYRQLLAANSDQVVFVYLQGDRNDIQQRMAERLDHFMALSLADSQFETLEEPDSDENVITVSINHSVEKIVDQVVQSLKTFQEY
ncbi:MAG: gluconokinase [Amphritea sp.]